MFDPVVEVTSLGNVLHAHAILRFMYPSLFSATDCLFPSSPSAPLRRLIFGFTLSTPAIQVMLTMSSKKLIDDLVAGVVDVALVYAGTLEELFPNLNASMFRVINPRYHIDRDGQAYPFVSSTDTVAVQEFAVVRPAEASQVTSAVVRALLDLNRTSINSTTL